MKARFGPQEAVRWLPGTPPLQCPHGPVLGPRVCGPCSRNGGIGETGAVNPPSSAQLFQFECAGSLPHSAGGEREEDQGREAGTHWHWCGGLYRVQIYRIPLMPLCIYARRRSL